MAKLTTKDTVMGSWRTTVIGILMLISIISGAAQDIINAPEFSFGLIITEIQEAWEAILAAIALIFAAKDGQTTSAALLEKKGAAPEEATLPAP